MNKYHHVGICMVGGFYLSSFPLQAVGSVGKAPHIILIMTDQQRADALGCAGNEAVISPLIVWKLQIRQE